MFKFLTCIIALIINNKLNHVHFDDKECTGSYCIHITKILKSVYMNIILKRSS